jgi:hypothetical protein
MPLYELTLKNGSTIQVEGPQGASAADLVNIYNRQTDTSGLAQERAIQEEIAARRARLRATAPTREAGVLDYLGEIPKGLAAGAAGLVESAALGAITPLDEEAELAAREAIQSAGRGVREYLEPDIGLEEAVPRKFSEALGSFGAIGLASLIPGVGVPLAGGLAVGAGAGEASERARAAGATEEERAQAAYLGALVGAGELLPIKFIKALGRPTTGTIVDRVKRAGASGGVEGAQEAAAEIAQNLIEQGIYNPEQGTFTNTGESAAYGAGVGAFVQAIVDLAMPGKPRGADVSPPEEKQLALPAPEERLGLPAPQARLPAPSTVVTPEGEAMTQGQADQLRREQERVRAEEALILGDMPSEEVRGAQERGRREAEDEQFLRELEEAQRTDYAEAQERAREREALRAAERGDEEAFAQPDLFAMEQEQARRTLGEPAPVQEEAPTPQAPMQETQMDIMDLIAQEQQRAESEQETAAGAEITAVQQEESQRRESALQEIIAADSRRTPDIRGTFQAVLESGGLSPQLTETEERMVRRAEDLRAAEDTVPRQLPSTPEDTQLAELEAAIPQRQLRGEQLTLEGVPSRRQEKRAQRLGATEPVRVEEPVEAPRPVTTEQLDAMGIPKAAPVRRRIQGRNLSAVPDQEFVRNQLTEFANAKATRPETKFKITKFLEGAPDEQLEMFGPRGGMPKTPKATRTEPTERRRDAEPQRSEPAPSGVGVQTGGRDTEVGRTPEEVRDTERAEPPRPDRLERAERDVADVADREGALPSALEEIATPKAVVPKRKRRSPVEVLDTARGKKPAEEAKAEPAEEAKAEPEAQKSVEKAAPKAQESAEKAKPKAQESAKATAELESVQEEVISTPFRAEFFTFKSEYKIKDTSLGTDKLIVMDLLRNVADPVKSRKSKTDPVNAARLYFGKKKRLVDALELIAHDMAFGVTTEQGGFQRAGETDVEAEFMSGLGNAKVARAAASWVHANLSPEFNKTFKIRQTKQAEFALDSVRQEAIADQILLNEYAADIEAGKATIKDVPKKLVAGVKEALARKAERDTEAEKQANLERERIRLDKQREKEATRGDKLDRRTTRELEKAFEEGVDEGTVEYIETQDAIALLRDSLNLPNDAVVASEIPLHPEAEVALRQGNLALALQRLATTTPNKYVRNAANKFLNVLGTTKVEVVEDLKNDAGKPVAGFFDPATNTIKLNAETGMTPHALLHELGHMATADTLRNPSHPLTKQITKLFNDVKDRLDTAYGATSVDEFAAEAQSNPEFRVLLSRITPKGETVSALEKFNHSVMNFLRRLFGMQTKPMDSALTQADMLIESILSPAAPSVNAEKLYLNTTRDGVLQTMKNLAQDMKAGEPMGKKFANDLANSSMEFLTSTAPRTAKNILIRFKDAVSLAQTGEALGLGRVGMDLYNLMNRQRGKIHAEDEKVRAAVKQLAGWMRRSGLEKRKAFSRVVYSPDYGSTLYQVDPNLSKAEAEKKYEKDPDKMRVWQAQRADWNAIGVEGQKQYNDMLAFYRKKYLQFKEVIDGQLDEALKSNPEAAKRLKNELFEKFFKNLELEIYAPLTRTGRYKVTYELKPEATPQGRESYVVEMTDTKQERKQLIAQLRDNPNIVQSTVTQIDGDLKLSNFKKAPPTSFVADVVKVLEANGVKSEVIEQIGRTFIEALPETSLAKSMQRRKNVLGYVQDPVQAMRTKGYDLSRQIERMRFNALLVDIENKIGNITTPTHAKIQAARKAFPKLSKEELAKELETSVGYIDSVDEIYKGATTNAQKDRAAEQVGELIEAIDGVKAEMQDRARFSRAGAKNKNVEPYVKFFNQTAFLFTIGFNPSSAAVQLAQVPMFVYPYLGADYGYRASASAINKASRVVGALNNDIERYYDVDDAGNFTLKQSEVDAIYSKATDPKARKLADEKVELLKDLQALTQAASEFGLLNRSYILDAMGLEESGRKTNIMDLLVAGSAYMFNHTERMNRQVTLVSSYKLELDRLRENNPRASDKELQAQAVERAIVLTQELNGGAVLETGPSITREGLGRVAGMYKTYGLRMYATMMKSAKQFAEDAKKKGVPAAMADTAFKQLLGVHGAAVFFAGVHGVPLYGAVQLFADLFLLEDDEDDFNTLVRKATGETWYKGIVNQITGMDIASRVRLTGLLIQENRYNTDPSPEEWLGFYFGGPALSVGKRLVSGVENIAEGEYERGAELLMPAGVTNMYKTTFGRYQESGGIYTRRQDPIYGDMGTGELMAQFFGFPPAEYTFRQEVNQRDKRVEGAVLTERTKLLRKYYVASRMGDYDELMDVMEKINKFNDKHSNVAITNDTVNKSMKKHAETSANMYDGVTISPLMRLAIEQSRMEYDNSFSLF